jgi:hypothetical protein
VGEKDKYPIQQRHYRKKLKICKIIIDKIIPLLYDELLLIENRIEERIMARRSLNTRKRKAYFV